MLWRKILTSCSVNKQKNHTYSNVLAVEVYGERVSAGLNQAAFCSCGEFVTNLKPVQNLHFFGTNDHMDSQ